MFSQQMKGNATVTVVGHYSPYSKNITSSSPGQIPLHPHHQQQLQQLQFSLPTNLTMPKINAAVINGVNAIAHVHARPLV